MDTAARPLSELASLLSGLCAGPRSGPAVSTCMSVLPVSPLLPVLPAVAGPPCGRLTALRTSSHCSREK
eukprot:60827-Lingulodinium_polyedra.AAC.1